MTVQDLMLFGRWRSACGLPGQPSGCRLPSEGVESQGSRIGSSQRCRSLLHGEAGGRWPSPCEQEWPGRR